MHKTILLVCVLISAALVGCGKGARLDRHLQRADAAFAENNLETARIEYLNAIRINPEHHHVLSRLGQIYYQQGDAAAAVQFLAAARTMNPNDLASRSKLGLILSSAGDCTNALTEIEIVLAKSPGDGDSLIALVGCAFTTNEINATLARLQALLPAQDTNAQLHLALGFLFQKKQQVADAEKAYLRAQALDPKSSKPPFALAGIYWARGDTNATATALQSAADLAPIKSSERLRLADFKMRSGQETEARQLLEDAVQKAPDFLAAINVLAEIALNERRTNDCANLVSQALKVSAKDRTARILKGRLKLALNETDSALEEFESLTRDFPQDPLSFYQLALAQTAKREPARAVVSLDRAILLRPNYPEAMLLRSELQVASGNSAAAIPSLTTLTTQYPGVQRAYVLLAEAYRLRGTPVDALRTYREMAKAFPKDAKPPYMTGLLLRQQGKFAEAHKSYEASLALNPDFLPAIDEIIELDIAQSNHKEALSRIETYVQKYSDKPMPLLLQAKVLNALKKFPEAEAALQKAIQIDPEFILAQRFLVQFYTGTKQHTNAIQRLEGMAQKNPNDSTTLLQLSLLYEATSDFQKARAHYEKVLAIKPNSTLALNNLAYLLSERLNDLDKAATFAQRARDLAPEDPSAADTYGWILFKRGDHARALAVLQQAAEKLSANPEVAYHLGMAHYANGNEAEARQALATAVKPAEKPYHGVEAAQRALAVLNVNPAAANPKEIETLDQAIAASKNDLFANIRSGQILERQAKYPEAKARFETALTVNPNSSVVLTHLAGIEIERLNNSAKGMELARRAWTLSQTSENAAYLGRLGALAGQYKWALPLLERAYQAQREDITTAFLLALVSYTQGDLERPNNLLQPLAASPKAAPLASQISAMLALLKFHSDAASTPAARTALPVLESHRYTKSPAQLLGIIVAQDAKSPQPAFEKYQALIAAEPEFILAQKQYALFAEQARNDSVASPLVAKLRQSFPNDAAVLRAAGRIAFRQKNYTEAARVLRTASRSLPEDADLLYHLGLSQSHLNEKAAKDTLTRALALDATSPFATEARTAVAKVQ